MNTRIHLAACFFILTGFLTVACLDDFNRSNDPMYYNPTFSVPIGPLNYTLDDIMPPEALENQIIDTSTVGDSIPLIIYNSSLFFENPGLGFDTLFTGAMNFSSISPDMEYAQSLMFRINYANEIPANLAIQMYFYIDNQLVDSLFENGSFWVAQALQIPDGITTIPFSGREEQYVDSTRIQNMMQVTNFELAIHVETYREGLDQIRVYSYYGFDLQLAMRAELLVPFE
ncbi:MAG: hypothetical protein JXB24_12290 [Bacteroidales bacterium]|nr:hypothetical protein [Bacteroidales bacterium]